MQSMMYGLYTANTSVCTSASREHVADMLIEIFKSRVFRQDKHTCYKKLYFYDGRNGITVIDEYQISKVPQDFLDFPVLAEINRVLIMGKSELRAEYLLCGGNWPYWTSRYGKQIVVLRDTLSEN